LGNGILSGCTPSPRSIGISILERKDEIISWNQQLAGKILSSKDLATLHPEFKALSVYLLSFPIISYHLPLRLWKARSDVTMLEMALPFWSWQRLGEEPWK
jgi:hypothetical protein